MTIGTAVLGKFAGAGLHFGGIIKPRGWLIMRVANDRIGADLDQRPMDDRGILLGAGNAIESAEEKNRSDDRENDCKCTNGCQNFHSYSPVESTVRLL